MGNRPATIAQQINYESYLSTFELSLEGRSLPTVFACPLCRTGSMQFLHDGRLNAVWASCSACGFAGDLIELAARFLKMPVPETIAELGRCGLMPRADGESADAYLTQHMGLRRRADDFWKTASANLNEYRSDAVYGLCENLGIHHILSDCSRAHFALRWVGLATKQSVEELFAPQSYVAAERVNHGDRRTLRRGSGPGSSRLFVGIGWDEVLVLPFNDQPGRISGFLFVGRDADPLKGDVFYRSLHYGSSSDLPHESGLCMLDTIDAKPDRLMDGKVFVCSDPLLAVRLQARSVWEFCQPLPLAATWRDHKHAPRWVWNNLPTSNLVCFGPTRTHAFRDALATGAAVGALKTKVEWPDSAIQNLKYVRRSSRPVLEAIRDELWRQKPSQARAWMESLGLTEAQRGDLKELAGERWENCLDDGPLVRRVMVAGKTIVETVAGWTLAKNNRLVCNARIRVQEIATLSDGHQWITGVALLDGHSIPFDAALAEIDRRGLLPVVRDCLLKRGAGVLIYDRSWATLGWELAIALQPPTFVSRPDRVGWNGSTRSFHFPKFRVRQSRENVIVPENMVSDGPLPFNCLQSPLAGESFSTSSAHHPDAETAIFWALTACILDSLLSSRDRRSKQGILLAGDSAAEIGVAVATELGCLSLDVPSRWSNSDLQGWLSKQTQAHDAPPVIQMDGGRGREAVWNWLGGLGEKHCVLPTNRWAALSLSSQHRWHVIESRHSVPRTWSPAEVRTEILPGYLADLARRSCWLPPSREPQVLRLIRDLATWYEERGGDAGEVRRARTVLKPAQTIDPATVFGEMLGMIRRQRDRGDKSLRSVLSDDGGESVLSVDGFEEFLRRQDAPSPDWPAILDGAAASGLHIRTDGPEGQTVWHVTDLRAAAG